MTCARWMRYVTLMGMLALLPGCSLFGYKMLPKKEFIRLTECETELGEQAQRYNLLSHEYELQTKDVDKLKGDIRDFAALVAERDKTIVEKEATIATQLGVMKTMSGALATLEDIKKRMKDTKDQFGHIPGTETIVTAEGFGVRMQSDVLFSAGMAVIRPAGMKTLNQVAAVLKTSSHKIRVCGYTDSDPLVKTIRTWKNNYRLSGERAMAVLAYLKKQGVPASRMHYAGYGEYDLIYANGVENKGKSRRAEILLLYATQGKPAPASSRRRVTVQPPRTMKAPPIK